jgi:sulfur relay (sulfurtransferase) DsrC/TusE family protein
MDRLNLFQNREYFADSWWEGYIGFRFLPDYGAFKTTKQIRDMELESHMHRVELVVNKQIKLPKKQNNMSRFLSLRINFDDDVPNDVYEILQSMVSEHHHNVVNVLNKFHSRYPRDPIISQLLEKIKRMSGFVLGVVVLFIYQYLMGYLETGRWNTYSNGAWEFRATYVCIELRLGSYPFQKFRETPRKYSGVTERTYHTRNGVIYKYEPWVRFRNPKFYFEGQTTAKKAARIRDVAKFWLKIKGRKLYNFREEDYNYLNDVQEFHPQQSDDEIKRLVLEHAQPFLKEGQQPQLPTVYQPCVEPARFASVEGDISRSFSFYAA